MDIMQEVAVTSARRVAEFQENELEQMLSHHNVNLEDIRSRVVSKVDYIGGKHEYYVDGVLALTILRSTGYATEEDGEYSASLSYKSIRYYLGGV